MAEAERDGDENDCANGDGGENACADPAGGARVGFVFGMIVHVNLHKFRLSGRHHQAVQQLSMVHISVWRQACPDAGFPFSASSVLRVDGAPPAQNRYSQ